MMMITLKNDLDSRCLYWLEWRRLNNPPPSLLYIQALLSWLVEFSAKGGPAIRDQISDALMRQQISGLTYAERFVLGETKVSLSFIWCYLLLLSYCVIISKKQYQVSSVPITGIHTSKSSFLFRFHHIIIIIIVCHFRSLPLCCTMLMVTAHNSSPSSYIINFIILLSIVFHSCAPFSCGSQCAVLTQMHQLLMATVLMKSRRASRSCS